MALTGWPRKLVRLLKGTVPLDVAPSFRLRAACVRASAREADQGFYVVLSSRLCELFQGDPVEGAASQGSGPRGI